MRAATLKSLGTPLSVDAVPELVLGTGEVLIDVAATYIVSYAGDVFSGKRKYGLDLPVIPGFGSIGRVRAIGPDATRLAIGDWVFSDPTVRSRDDAVSPDILLQGLFSGNEGGRRLHQYFHDGSLAERMRVPTECVSRIGAIDAAEAPAWCALGTLLVPYGGLLAAGLEAGQTVLVNGATGAFGSAAVAVALAMGARAVLATGRNGAVLHDLARRFGERVRPVPMQGDEQQDRERILAATPAPIDCMLDFLPAPASAAQVRTAIMAVRPYGTIAIMGGVGGSLDLPYPWLMHNCITIRGQYMYPREAVGKMIGLIRAGLVKLDEFALTTFELAQVNEAVTHAAQNAGPFKLTIVCPRAAEH